MPALAAIGVAMGATAGTAGATALGAATLAGTAASAVGPIVGAKLSAGAARHAADTQAQAARDAARMQTESADNAARLESDANARALQFQKEQAEQAYQSGESTRHANYDQWASGQRRLWSIDDALGQGHREIPDYAPTPALTFSTGASAPTIDGALAAGAPAAGTVMMIAPTGSRKAVPADQVQYFVSKGARVVQ